LEQRELTYTSSSATYLAAIYRFEDLKKQLDFAAAQSKKLLSISKTITEDYIIRSKTDGRVYSITKELGEIVTTQNPIAVIGDADHFITELQVDETDIARIKIGLQTLLSLDAFKGQVFSAQVTNIHPIMNERSRTFTVEAIFSDQPPVLYPNLSVEANIVIATKDHVITIPRAYLQHDSLVTLANKSSRRVTVGLKDYQTVEILRGLDAHETILKTTK
jgi:multidrug efflux pump subunit AcrA (membrane-fusion protein)